MFLDNVHQEGLRKQRAKHAQSRSREDEEPSMYVEACGSTEDLIRMELSTCGKKMHGVSIIFLPSSKYCMMSRSTKIAKAR